MGTDILHVQEQTSLFFARQDLLFAIFDVLNISTSVGVYMSLIFMKVSLIHMDYFYFYSLL